MEGAEIKYNNGTFNCSAQSISNGTHEVLHIFPILARIGNGVAFYVKPAGLDQSSLVRRIFHLNFHFRLQTRTFAKSLH